jgi:hypothetical protein
MSELAWSNAQLGAFLTERFRRLDDTLAKSQTSLREPFREAAAVLASFRPATLRPFNARAEDRAAFDELLDDSIAPFRPSDADEPVWALKADIRRSALEALSGRGQLAAALEANPDRERSPLQEWLERGLGGSLPDPATLAADDLAHMLQVVEWLEGIVPNLPPRDRIRALLNRSHLMAPFEHLLANGFAGRTSEIDRLRNFVGVRPSATTFGKISRLAIDTFGSEQKPPLIVWGIGGVGKSTLMAKFIEEHALIDREMQFPFVYFDFDSGWVGLARSSALAVQFLSQIVNQYPERAAAAARFRRRYDRFLAMPETTSEGRVGPQRKQSKAAAPRPASLTRTERAIIKSLAAVARPLLTGPEGQTRPLLVVLDTFENVQEFSDARVRKIAAYAAELQSHLPTLRVVVSGRNDVDRFVGANGSAATRLPITELDPPAVDAMLSRLGITDPAQRESIRGLAGGNPLTVRLVAERSLRGNLDTSFYQRATTRAQRLLPAGEILIQSYHYERILLDIDDTDVQKLASPGLALRYITPDIIKEVLAGPCQLRVEKPADAQRLFDALQKYAQLVTSDGQGLRHRSDVRRTMLKQLDQDRPGLVHKINENAVTYHRKHDALVNRAEEIYHRLRLNQNTTEIDPRWTPDVADWLRNSLPELPARAQLYLVRRNVATDLVGTTESALSKRDQEALAASKVTDLLAHGLIDDAQKVLSEALPGRSPSPLALVDAQLAILVQRWDDAQDRLDEAQRAAIADADTEELETALLLATWVASHREDFEFAERLAARTEDVLRQKTARPVRRAWLIVLRRRAWQGLSRDVRELDDHLQKTIEMSPSVLRDPRLARQALPCLIGHRSLFRSALESGLVGAESTTVRELVRRLRSGGGADAVAKLIDGAFESLAQTSGSRLFDTLLSLLERDEDRWVARALATAMAEPDDVTLFGVQDAPTSAGA